MAHTVMEYGIAKTQKLSAQYWDELRGISTRAALTSFFRLHRVAFEPLLRLRTSERKVEEILQGKGICDDSEFDYLSEAMKSSLFRAGGTNIMDWGCWYVSTGREIRTVGQGMEQISINGDMASVPVRYAVGVPQSLYNSMRAATVMIHDAIQSQVQGPKLISRVDFVLDEDTAHIVDVGESNTTLGLADGLRKFAGLGSGTLLPEYLSRVLAALRETQPGFARMAFCAENQQMIDNLPYEFRTFEHFVRDQFDIPVSTIIHKNLAAHHDAAIVRCFRGLRHTPGTPMVDDAAAMPLYQKDGLLSLLDNLEFPHGCSVPYHTLVPLSDTPEETAQRIMTLARERGLADFIVKPGAKSRKTSMAFLYVVDNPAHLRQLQKTVRRFQEERMQRLIIEEYVGAGIVDGRKLEIRVHCLTGGA